MCYYLLETYISITQVINETFIIALIFHLKLILIPWPTLWN